MTSPPVAAAADDDDDDDAVCRYDSSYDGDWSINCTARRVAGRKSFYFIHTTTRQRTYAPSLEISVCATAHGARAIAQNQRSVILPYFTIAVIVTTNTTTIYLDTYVGLCRRLQSSPNRSFSG